MEVETLIKKLKRIKKSIKGIEENIESIVSMVDVNATKCKLEYANIDLMKMSDIFLQKLEDEDLNDEVENCIDKCIRLKCELDLRHNGQETSEKEVNLHVKMPKLELPTFDGRLESWLSFKDLFFSAVGSNSQIPNIEKLQYLKGQLRGEALRLVNAFPITADNYVEVWQTLLTRYDNPKDLIFTQIDNALRLPKLADDNHKSMFKLLDSCNEIVRTVKVLGYQIDSLSDVFLVKIIQDKLDKTTRKQWELQNNPRVVPSIKDLMEFLEIHAKSLQNLPNKDANVEESSIKRETAPKMEVQQKQWGHPGRSPMDYSSKRRPCRICLNRGHAGRFHPENRCWFREKAVQASPAASFIVEFDEKLSPYEKSDLIKLIKENKEAFAAHKMDIGHIKADPIRIKLTSQTPISLKPFRPSFSDNIEIKRQIEELLKYNVIRPSYSSYASPAMLVNKRNEGKIRLVIDYRKLNDIIKRDSEPIPRIDSILDKLSEANIFTTLDLLSGYHHLDIHPDDKEYTAFTTTHGLYEFNKLSFGLKNSPRYEISNHQFSPSTNNIETIRKLNSTKKFLHIIVDHATRYIWAFPSKSQTTDSYINCLNKIFQIQKPKQFLSDRAPSFTSPRFRKYLINNNIKQLLTSSSRPQCNGLNERLNQTIITRLRCKFNNLKGKSIPWTKLLDSVLNEYNNTPHSITGYTPTYLLYGKLPYDPPVKESEFYPPIDTARTNAYNNTLKFHQINKLRYDQHYQPSTFKVGDKVWLQTFYHPDNRKLMPPMSGPFTILKQISPVNYEIDKPQSNLGKTTMVIHSSKLRPYYPKEGFELKLTKSKIPTLEKKPSQQVAPKVLKSRIPLLTK
ncbi:hypothetical protein LAZ67_16001856 [Cordylochernes scorpioides]|uniref:Integrase catalytic domain-containing protein n=1 Tax=Cordylochernes scorpioides TaxID=51811 RepID=A0ABY6LBV0_9ARAC|nr:hypothetical protein LAZ67_16001856 [Cordylochernes scorpioides]